MGSSLAPGPVLVRSCGSALLPKYSHGGTLRYLYRTRLCNYVFAKGCCGLTETSGTNTVIILKSAL